MIWYKIAESEDELFINKESLIEIEIAGKMICIGKHQEVLRACVAKCPHAGGKMADGYIDALGNIVCPLHRYRFSLNNGRNISGEGYFLKTYSIETRDNGVFVAIEEKKETFEA